LLDDTQPCPISLIVSANRAKLFLAQIEARAAVSDIASDPPNRIGKSNRFCFGYPQQMKRETFRTLSPDAWEPTELVDEFGNGTCVLVHFDFSL
jgi:hypothetical protein